MKIVSFPEGQGSEAWLKWRNQGIGASDIPVIMGTSRYKTPLQLWNEKCGYQGEQQETPPMRYGKEREPIARHWLNTNLGLNLEPICVEDEENSVFRASLDGYDFDRKVVVEIKSPLNRDIIEQARLNQFVPEEYVDQNQWQIILTQAERAIIAVWDEENQCCITIENFCMPDRQKDMKERAKKFWHQVVIGQAPPPQKQDYIIIETPELKNLLKEYGELDEIEKAAAGRKKELKEEITNLGDGNFLSYGYQMTWCRPKATYNIEQMKLDGVDIDKYLNEPKTQGFYRIRTPKFKKQKSPR
jgi:putative phage-type endonuclease